MKKIEFIYFDVGGVLLEYEHAYEDISNKTGKTYSQIAEVLTTYAALGKANIDQILQDYNRELGLNLTAYDEFVNFYTNAFIPIQETHTLLKKLSSIYPLGILSNTEPHIIETSIKLGKIPNVPYKIIVASCDVGYLKPSKEIYLLAQQKAEVPPEQILFIDDVQKNLDAANSLGWQTLLFNTHNPKDSVAAIKKILQDSLLKNSSMVY